ncbi:deoxyribodipyrimidine photo-lyase [Celerinatantimonas diazotrophica]|uniref:Deoxyribodipyrimidine photo-lyase n=1 Tax=Celerinatantimonas diazotrophica TaxID=412034 RepID=A0A4R1KFG6_9GAMM|nr:deoxyribodipyrimidine photo-lyase [Celerinatantimonas diazotrophica]TCK63374.1 deoxyribodipyrimidine photo-lyase [Celerinatantimonas diazotrophica]CAG9294918.1 Deoxyribodipyrimidine photo-lyase [Celerinatantimonas diazotrophica]
MAKLVWFRHDLRTLDNPMLNYACRSGQPVYGCYLITAQQWQRQNHSPLRNQYVLNRLSALRQELADCHIPLIIKSCDDYDGCLYELEQLCMQLAIDEVVMGAEYGLWERQRDEKIHAALATQSIPMTRFTSQVLVAPGEVTTAQGQPYRVFTPFSKAWKAQLSLHELSPLAAPKQHPQNTKIDEGLSDAQLTRFAGGESCWPVTQEQVLNHLNLFVKQKVSHYQQWRDFPSEPATSRLSVALAHGVFSTAQALHLLQQSYPEQYLDPKTGPGCWLNELIWREFYIQLLAQFDTISQGLAFKSETRAIQWEQNPAALTAWQQGKTGIPIVDAGMRQLNEIGWMHNRVRMICASFLCKNLWLDWREGEKYFMSKLIDGHLASNNGGWQWSASTGTDAAPYFRVFNPISQSQKFDPQGDYIRHWVNELASLSAAQIHDPDNTVRQKVNYPQPLVDLKQSRKQAIARFAAQTKRD